MYIYPDKNLLKDQGSIFFKEKYVFLFVITFCWKSRIFENEYTYEVYKYTFDHWHRRYSTVVMQKGICMGYQVGVSSLDANANGNVEK